MIVEYNKIYDEDIKDLLVELQEYIASIDKEKNNILTDDFREKCFKYTIKEVNEKDGKILLAIKDNKAIGLIIGFINNEAYNDYSFIAQKRGRISELIITKKYRGSDIGTKLLEKMEFYLKSIGCKDILIEVFGYNDLAINFYKKRGYHTRLIEVIKNNV